MRYLSVDMNREISVRTGVIKCQWLMAHFSPCTSLLMSNISTQRVTLILSFFGPPPPS